MTRFLQVGGSYVIGPDGGAFAVEPPTAALSLVSGDLYEGNVATFRATLSKPWIVDVSVTYATSNGTASAGTDYTAASGTATITAGDLFAAIPVTTTLRSGSQSSRTFTLTISAAADADDEPVAITTPAVTATILDTASAPEPPTLSVAAVAAANEGDPLTFWVTASFAPTEDITFAYATSNGSATAGTDYTAASGTGTIAAGTLTDDIAITTALREGFQGARTVVLTISNAETASEEPVTIATAAATGTISETEIPEGANGYADALYARADYWKGISFRPIAGRPQVYASGMHAGKLDPYYADQLKAPGDGGYANSNSNPLVVTYAPGGDTDPNAQDAAKIVIGAFNPSVTLLGADLASDATVINLGVGTSFDNGATFLIGDELITLTSGKPKADATTTCARGQFGTTAVAHTAGETLRRSGNSLTNQIRLPIATTAGQSYLFTWDTFHTDSYCRKPGIGETSDAWLKNHKAFQFTSKSNSAGNIWMEPATRFKSEGTAPSPNPAFDNTIHVCEIDWRSYMVVSTDTVFDPLNPNRHPVEVTRNYPLRPMEEAFIMHPNRWLRWWVHIEHVIDDYDILNVWVADEVQDPVHIFDNVRVKAWQPGVPNGVIRQWWVELNTSDTEHFRLDMRDLVAYIRNFSAHTMPVEDVAALLVKPE